MKLQQLLQGLTEYHSENDAIIKGLALNSKQVQPGDLFVALMRAEPYIQEAIIKGASAVIAESAEMLDLSKSNTPIIHIKNLAEKLHVIASRFYEDPQQNFDDIIGVTGTNGKTTTCYILAQALSRLAKPCAFIGTIGVGMINALVDSGYTTPDLLALHKYMRLLANQGAKALTMEVTSQGLIQGRVNYIRFDSAHFTNLTQDHLDYHLNMQAYGKAKEKLFQFPTLKRVVVNGDSAYSQKMLQALRRDIPVAMYSLKKAFDFKMKQNIYPMTVTQINLDQKGIKAKIQTPWGQGLLRSTLLGDFNLSNLLGVLAELCLQGYDFKNCLEVLAQMHAPPGRMQKMGNPNTPQVIIDYAHTPDALENALKSARLHCTRRLWCVFGCGGDRDKEKRAPMGNIATTLADKIVITSDNPRTENPTKIIEDILQGIPALLSEKVIVQENREAAIAYAINHALAVDTIVIAGKGHENYQIVGKETIPFSDVACVRTLLREET
ncbi:MAG: UDP-N-acetylmuramoyl-L-alanyl-D-glutamate--2,6-diaminopimelate ligase [Proteobacteria bacterium]|nr:UDP-N-acetylmuramoyl-L-alanyl-D-glutamate--2,6-diaminopimelate ligase [Pseudomonadota bacterium]